MSLTAKKIRAEVEQEVKDRAKSDRDNKVAQEAKEWAIFREAYEQCVRNLYRKKNGLDVLPVNKVTGLYVSCDGAMFGIRSENKYFKNWVEKDEDELEWSEATGGWIYISIRATE